MKSVVLKFAGYALAATLIMPASAMAGTKTYDCKVRDQGNLNWISPWLVIRHDEDSGDVEVLDGLIKHYYDKPVVGKLNTNNAKRITFVWKLEGGEGKDGAHKQTGIRVVYRASIKPDGSVIVSGKPVGYRNTFRGKGRCKVKS